MSRYSVMEWKAILIISLCALIAFLAIVVVISVYVYKQSSSRYENTNRL